MYIHDSHVHTKYSFDGARDGSGEIDVIIETAISRGVNEISLCDHCDIDDILDGIYPEYPAEEIKADVLRAKEKHKGKIQINYGVELGQAHVRPVEARELLDKYGFDFVIGSLHNLRGYPDFHFLKLSEMCGEHIEYLMTRTFSELRELVDFGCFSTLAHITYIQRYLALAGKDFDYRKYRDEYESLFRALITTGTALEVNTSGLRRGSITMPGYELCGMYRELGGEFITLGSDAHTARDVSLGIEEAAAALRDIGFRSQTVVRGGVLAQVEL